MPKQSTVVTMTEQEAWFNWYQEQGIKCFPLYGVMNGKCRCPKGEACGKTSGKHPRHNDWRNRPAMMPGPLDNFGVSTDNLVIVDIDIQDKALLTSYPETYVTCTGNGYHLWYQANSEVDIKTAVKWRPHTDVRAIGGLVVAPPSKHYSGIVYAPYNDLPIIQVTPELLAELPKKDEGPERLGREVSIQSDSSNPLVHGFVEDACARMSAAQEGTRNHTLFQIACQMFRVIDLGWVGADGLEALMDAAIATGLTPGEVATTLYSAQRNL